jgi:opacity protein-like surface antigen
MKFILMLVAAAGLGLAISATSQPAFAANGQASAGQAAYASAARDRRCHTERRVTGAYGYYRTRSVRVCR